MDRKEETRNFYDKTASQAFKEWFDNPTLLPTLSAFINHLPENPSVLDLGCGTGGESKRLSGLGAKVTGVDFSKRSIEYAMKNVPEADFILMDILLMDFPDECFDGIVEAGVLFHFTGTEQDKILPEIHSMLKPGGIFLSYYPEGEFEGMQEMSVSGELVRRYCRLLPLATWINQVMKNEYKRYIKHDFNAGPFKCVEFYK